MSFFKVMVKSTKIIILNQKTEKVRKTDCTYLPLSRVQGYSLEGKTWICTLHNIKAIGARPKQSKTNKHTLFSCIYDIIGRYNPSC